MYAFFLLHRNSQRPGAVTNLTCLEAAKVEHYEIKGDAFAVVKVADHKTSATYGEANLVMDKGGSDVVSGLSRCHQTATWISWPS